MNDITRLIIKNLDKFLSQRQEKFQGVTEEQKAEWAAEILKSVLATLDDNDIFYENMPESVVEH